MKRTIIRAISVIMATISFCLVTAEVGSGVGQILWTSGCLAVFAVAARLLESTMTKSEKEEQV